MGVTSSLVGLFAEVIFEIDLGNRLVGLRKEGRLYEKGSWGWIG